VDSEFPHSRSERCCQTAGSQLVRIDISGPSIEVVVPQKAALADDALRHLHFVARILTALQMGTIIVG
jgi:hypothetical protein